MLLLGNSPLPAADLLVDGLPESYIPGENFVFDVRLTGAEDLNLFSIDLLLTAENGIAGIDFFFNETATIETPSRYVFDLPGVTPDGFAASANVDGVYATMNLSDLLAPGEMVDTVDGINDLVATISVTTTPAAGSLTLDFDTSFLELLDDSGNPIPGFDELAARLEASDGESITAVPEPGSLCLLLSLLTVSGLLAACRHAASMSGSGDQPWNRASRLLPR